MKITYLGTAAAEGIPALYCTCDICKNAKEVGGKEIRTRSQALINGDLLIDYPPDTYAHYLANGFDLPGITQLLITHSHTDHFYPADLEMRAEYFANPVPPLLNIYANHKVEDMFRAQVSLLEQTCKTLRFHRATPFEAFSAGDYKVTPLPALHDRSELCLIYLIEQGGKTVLYGNDTGIFDEDVWYYLERTKTRLSLASLDCTCMKKPEGKNHMGFADCVEVRKRLLDMKAADESTIFVLNHFSHNGGWTHDEMEMIGEEDGFLTSHDGMIVDF